MAMKITVAGKLIETKTDGDFLHLFIRFEGETYRVSTRDNGIKRLRERGILIGDPVVCFCYEGEVDGKKYILLKEIVNNKL